MLIGQSGVQYGFIPLIRKEHFCSKLPASTLLENFSLRPYFRLRSQEQRSALKYFRFSAVSKSWVISIACRVYGTNASLCFTHEGFQISLKRKLSFKNSSECLFPQLLYRYDWLQGPQDYSVAQGTTSPAGTSFILRLMTLTNRSSLTRDSPRTSAFYRFLFSFFTAYANRQQFQFLHSFFSMSIISCPCRIPWPLSLFGKRTPIQC